MKPFYIGLSRVSNLQSPGNQGLHACGRQILECLNGGTEEIGTEKGGRPFFTGAHADFSISHSRNMAAVAYWTEKDAETGLPLRTGCDIQYLKPRKNCVEIARRYFSPGEQNHIAAASGEAARLERFYRIWVLKECFLKTRGLSVFDMGTAPSFAGPDCLITEINLPLHFFLYELGEAEERYLLAVVREGGGPCPSPEFRWFSAPLPLMRVAVIR